MNWKLLGTLESVDLIPYVKEYLSAKPEANVYIGTDSQNTGKRTHYACVVVLYIEGKGGHVIYAQETLPIIRDMFAKLWREVEQSMQIAAGIHRMLEEAGIEKVVTIDLDLNQDHKYKSNSVMRAALGWGESYGYAVRFKPDALAASYAADKLVKTHKPRNSRYKNRKVSA